MVLRNYWSSLNLTLSCYFWRPWAPQSGPASFLGCLYLPTAALRCLLLLWPLRSWNPCAGEVQSANMLASSTLDSQVSNETSPHYGRDHFTISKHVKLITLYTLNSEFYVNFYLSEAGRKILLATPHSGASLGVMNILVFGTKSPLKLPHQFLSLILLYPPEQLSWCDIYITSYLSVVCLPHCHVEPLWREGMTCVSALVTTWLLLLTPFRAWSRRSINICTSESVNQSINNQSVIETRTLFFLREAVAMLSKISPRNLRCYLLLFFRGLYRMV